MYDLPVDVTIRQLPNEGYGYLYSASGQNADYIDQYGNLYLQNIADPDVTIIFKIDRNGSVENIKFAEEGLWIKKKGGSDCASPSSNPGLPPGIKDPYRSDYEVRVTDKKGANPWKNYCYALRFDIGESAPIQHDPEVDNNGKKTKRRDFVLSVDARILLLGAVAMIALGALVFRRRRA